MKTTNKTDTVKTAWYKKASFPWIVILLGIVFLGGLIIGWDARSNQVNDVRAQVQTELSVVNAPKAQ